MNTPLLARTQNRKTRRASNGLEVRCLNLQASLNLLRDGKPMTSPEIGDALGVHPSTVSRLLGALESAGLVSGTDSAAGPAAGRPPKVWQVNGEAGAALGLAVHSQVLRGVLVDLSGHLLARHESVYEPQLTAEAFAPAVGRFAREIVSGLPQYSVLGVGVATSGVVDPATGVVRLSGGLRTVDDEPATDFPLRAELAPELPWPMFVANDANVGAIATFQRMVREGRLAPDGSLLYLMAGDSLLGYGGGLVMAGRLHSGAHGAAGEILHPTLLEPIPSLEGLPLVVPEPGDEEAAAVVIELLRPILEHLAALAMTFDPNVVVLGGALGVLGNPLLVALGSMIAQAPGFGEYMADLATDSLILDPLRPDTIALGAAQLVLDDLFRDPIVGAPGPLVRLALQATG